MDKRSSLGGVVVRWPAGSRGGVECGVAEEMRG